MIKLVIIFILVFSFVLLQACNGSEEKASLSTDSIDGKVLDFISDTLDVIDLPDSLTNVSDYYQPINSENIYFLDNNTNCIFCYRTSNTSLDSICYFNVDPYYESFTVNERDSIINVFYENKIAYIDFSGKEIKHKSIKDLCG